MISAARSQAASGRRALPRDVSRRSPHRDASGRAASTAIYFLLARGERSHWHRVDAVEIWHWHAGAPLRLEIARRPEAARARARSAPISPPANDRRRWCRRTPGRRRESLGDWTLVGCTVAPGFDFAGFELAPTGWAPE